MKPKGTLGFVIGLPNLENFPNTVNWKVFRKYMNRGHNVIRHMKRLYFNKKLDVSLRSKMLRKNLEDIGFKRSSIVCEVKAQTFKDHFLKSNYGCSSRLLLWITRLCIGVLKLFDLEPSPNIKYCT